MEGWIKLHRKLMEWEWYKYSNMVHLFIHLLFKANRVGKKWKGIEIKRGQLITGRKKLSDETGLSEREIRTCLHRLNKTGETTSRTTNRFTIITINEYDNYQFLENYSDQLNANKRPTNDQQTTTTKELKKEKNINNINIREENFKKEVAKFKNYPLWMLKEFTDYWTEPNKSGTKMLWEMKETWDLKRRLERWSANTKLKAPVSKKQPEESRTNKTMSQADLIKYFKEHGKYPGK